MNRKAVNSRSKDEIRRLFNKRKRIRIWIMGVALTLVLIITVLGFPDWEIFGMPKLKWAPYFYLVMFAMLAAIGLVWRCPVCKGMLGDIFSTRYCPKCGYDFRI